MIYRYLYYKVFVWYNRTYGKEGLPLLSTLLIVSFVALINLSTLFLSIQKTAKLKLLDFFEINRNLNIILIILIPLINYLLLIYRGKHEKILLRFNEENKTLRKKRNLYLFIYLAISVFSLIAVIVFL